MSAMLEMILHTVTGQRFVVAKQLPESEHPIPGYRLVDVAVQKGVTKNRFVSALVTALGGKPKRAAEENVRQLRQLIAAVGEKGESVVFIVHDAQLLSPDTIWTLKPLSEMLMYRSENTKGGIGFVLLGDVKYLHETISEIPDIKLRTDFLRG
ncbi:hypothetical protein [Chrysiogenes arsenatis]|uniref:hypothetical protein n=1 Tax=Chrysiogenes arsenatis TaxID=309797 RepID=UPI000410D3C4|nr:hypothetical protein [Chrysiogenes arsenatis]